MSPEQARGKPVDRRADIWAFGCVLNDMLTGNQTFAGETLSDVLAAVIQTEPDFAVLPLDTPPRIRDLLARSLNKNSKNRLRDIGDARLVIEASLDPSRAIAVNKAGWAEARATRRSQTIVWSLAVLAALSIGVTFWSLLRGPPPPTRPIARLVVTLPPTDRLALGNTPVLSLSPDGSRLVYVANDSGSTQLHVRAIGRFEATTNEGGAAFSPDGRWLAYQSDESGRAQIYVRPFPGPGGKSQISTEGGTELVWSRDGRELFYRNRDKNDGRRVETKPRFAAGKPKLLFEGHYETSIYPFEPDYDVSPDGQRFLMIKAGEQESAATQLNVVLNWSDELRRLAPAGKP